MAVLRSIALDGFSLLTTFGLRARIGTLAADFFAGQFRVSTSAMRCWSILPAV